MLRVATTSPLRQSAWRQFELGVSNTGWAEIRAHCNCIPFRSRTGNVELTSDIPVMIVILGTVLYLWMILCKFSSSEVCSSDSYIFFQGQATHRQCWQGESIAHRTEEEGGGRGGVGVGKEEKEEDDEEETNKKEQEEEEEEKERKKQIKKRSRNVCSLKCVRSPSART